MIDFFEIFNFLFRSIHVVAGIAWVGASFYFVMLDASLRPPRGKKDQDDGVFGEIWAVHGGGIYTSKKYLKEPKSQRLPDELHWSKWEAYTTWLSGMSLLALIYWSRAQVYLIDNSVMALSTADAIILSIVFISGFWLIYHFACKALNKVDERVFAFILFCLISLMAWGLDSVFSGRGAFMMFGACLGTTMAANVFFVIIPGQKKMLKAITSGRELDPQVGATGKQRSVHNTYFTLPVLFCMLVNHYAAFYSVDYGWLVLLSMSLSGVFIRLFFVSRHKQTKPNYLIGVLGLVILALTIAFVFSPKPVEQPTSVNPQEVGQNLISIGDVKKIIDDRCLACHSSTPTFAGFVSPPKGIVYDSQSDVINQAEMIYQQAVVLQAMPIGNLTGLTDSEREMLGSWFKQLKQ